LFSRNQPDRNEGWSTDVHAHLARILGAEGLIIGVIALFKSTLPLALGLLIGGAALLLAGYLRPQNSQSSSENG